MYMDDIAQLTKEEAISLISNKHSKLKDFLNKYCKNYFEINEETGILIFDEVSVGQRQFRIEVPFDDTKKETEIIFRDDLTDYCQVADAYDINREQWASNFLELLNNIKALGCFMYDNCNVQQDYYGWYDLTIPISKFTEDALLKCETLWSDYNNKLNEFIR